MLFAINDLDNPIVIESNASKFDPYELTAVKPASEAEMFQFFRKQFQLKESINAQKLSMEIDEAFAGVSNQYQNIPTGMANYVNKNGVKYTKPPTAPTGGAHMSRKYSFPTSGCYIIPKLFGYFPFLDCDSLRSFNDAKVSLALDDIPYVAYKSSKSANKFWIFCDKQMPFYDALRFIESYPHDHRYSWVAGYKKELCVRAVAKYFQIPAFVEDHLVSSFTDDFTFWVKKFDEYWESNLILNYMTNLQTLEEL